MAGRSGGRWANSARYSASVRTMAGGILSSPGPLVAATSSGAENQCSSLRVRGVPIWGVSSKSRWMLVVPHFASPTTKTLGKGPILGIVGHPLLRDGVVAEREGFEPSRRFPAYTLSRRAPSTTRPPLRQEPETTGSCTGQVPVRAACPLSPASELGEER